MNFKEAHAKALKTFEGMHIDHLDIYRNIVGFIRELALDQDLSPNEKLELLAVVKFENYWSMGMCIAGSAYLGDVRGLENYFLLISELLDQNVDANELFSKMFEYEGSRYTSTEFMMNFCFVMIAYQKNDALQNLFKILNKMHSKGVSVQKIIPMLMKPFYSDDKTKSTFFDRLKRDSGIDITELLPLIIKYLEEFVSFDDMRKNPNAFIAQLDKSYLQIQALLSQLPMRCFKNKDLALLKCITEHFAHLKANTLETAIVEDSQEISLLSASINYLKQARNSCFKTIDFQCAFEETKLLPELENSLVTIFRNIETVYIRKCAISKKFMHILTRAQQQAGDNFSVKKVFLIHVAVDETVLKELLEWATSLSTPEYCNHLRFDEGKRFFVTTMPNIFQTELPQIAIYGHHTQDVYEKLMGSFPSTRTKGVLLARSKLSEIVIRDPYVAELEIRAQKMTRSMFNHDAFLRFLTAMSGLQKLYLAALDFEDDYARRQCIKQALQKPGLTELTIELPISDVEIKDLFNTLKTNHSLTRLILPQGRFSNGTLLELAEALRHSNTTLQEITLAQGCYNPTPLATVLKRNHDHTDSALIQSKIDEILHNLRLFADTVNRNPVETNQLFSAHETDLLRIDRSCQLHAQQPLPSTATSLYCEKAALAYSIFLRGIGHNAVVLMHHQNDFIREQRQLNIIKKLKNAERFLPFLINPEPYHTFYQNLYDSCNGCYEAFLRPEQDKSGIKWTGQLDNPIALNMRETLIITLKLIPRNNSELSHKTNNLLFTLYKQNILLALLREEDKASRDLFNYVSKQNSIDGVIAELNHYFKNSVSGIWKVAPEMLRPALIVGLEKTRDDLMRLNELIKAINHKPLANSPAFASAKVPLKEQSPPCSAAVIPFSVPIPAHAASTSLLLTSASTATVNPQAAISLVPPSTSELTSTSSVIPQSATSILPPSISALPSTSAVIPAATRASLIASASAAANPDSPHGSDVNAASNSSLNRTKRVEGIHGLLLGTTQEPQLFGFTNNLPFTHMSSSTINPPPHNNTTNSASGSATIATSPAQASAANTASAIGLFATHATNSVKALDPAKQAAADTIAKEEDSARLALEERLSKLRQGIASTKHVQSDKQPAPVAEHLLPTL